MSTIKGQGLEIPIEAIAAKAQEHEQGGGDGQDGHGDDEGQGDDGQDGQRTCHRTEGQTGQGGPD